MEMYVTDRCRWFDARTESWMRGEITDISIVPFPAEDSARTEVVITVSTVEFGEFVLLGSEWHLNHIDFRITFSDFPRAKAAVI